MKQFLLGVLFTHGLMGLSDISNGQTALTSLNETFESNCPSGQHHPNGWMDYNPIASTRPDGQWKCTEAEGRGDTRGIKCSGLWGTPLAYHLDTAFLISPKINLSSYAGQPIYLRFDSKTSKVNLGAKIGVVAFTDSSLTDYVSNLDQLMNPLFTNDDSTDWVTHEFDLSGFTTLNDFYLAFRYTSPATTGSVWYLDNILTTTAPLKVHDQQMPTLDLPLNATGNSETGEVKVAISSDKSDVYDLVIYDVVGRMIHRQQLDIRQGRLTYVISGLNISRGIYILKAGNSYTSGTSRFWAQ